MNTVFTARWIHFEAKAQRHEVGYIRVVVGVSLMMLALLVVDPRGFVEELKTSTIPEDDA